MPFDSERVTAPATRLRTAGIALRVSFGGHSGRELAQSCRSPDRLSAAYQAVVGRYRPIAVDFDIEGSALLDRRAAASRGEAIARLQAWAAAHGHPILTSMTLPVDIHGFPMPALRSLQTTLAQRARVDIVNALAMDYGDRVLPHPQGQMASAAIHALAAGRRQLRRLSAPLGSWRRIGITPMIGVNDVSDEVFTLMDAVAVSRFARDHRLRLISMWSLARDNPCPSGPQPAAAPTCSGVGNPPYAFARAFGARPRAGVHPRIATEAE